MNFLDISNDLSVQGQISKAKSSDSTEEHFILILAEKVAAYLENNPDLLMSYMYRLDVDEAKIHDALSNQREEPGHIRLARVIWNRQKKRLETKQKYKSQGSVMDWDDF